MGKIKVYELAKELNVQSKDIVNYLQEKGIEGKAPQSALEDDAVAIITEDARLFIPLDELVDFKAELERLEKEKAAVQKEIAFVSGKLNNANFVAKAPEALVNEQREKLAKYNEKLAMLEESIAKIANK